MSAQRTAPEWRRLVLFTAFIFLYTAAMDAQPKTAPGFWPEEKSPVLVGKKVMDNLLERGGFMLYDTGDVRALHYAEAAAVLGAARLAGLLKDRETLDKLEMRYAADKLPPNTANHVDANVCGIIPLELSIQRGDRGRRDEGLALADGQWQDPSPEGLTAQTRFWIDDIWMIGILQVEAYRATKKQVYLERAALEIDAYLKKLQQPSGLFFHGEQARFYWGRGNGWAAAGMAELLAVLPKTNPHYASILAGYRKMMEALLACQADDGMWRQLLDHEEAWKETSGTAMFGYAVALGVKKGLLEKKRFEPVFQKAWLALADYVDESGRVREVCTGTWQQNNAAFYLKRPRTTGDFHGQAPLLWFAWALLEKAGQ